MGEKSAPSKLNELKTIAQHLDIVATISFALAALFSKYTTIATLGGVVGALLVVQRYILTSKISDVAESLISNVNRIDGGIFRIGKSIDISENTNIDELRNLIRAYLSITEPQFRFVKEKIIFDSIGQLQKIAHEKVSSELGRGEYYHWLLPMLDEVPAGGHIRAISMMNDAEWDDSAEEKLFLKKNIDAAERGVKIERIFVSKRSVLLDSIKNAPTEDNAIKTHMGGDDSNINGFFADADKLSFNDPRILSAIGSGFLELDGKVALVDRFSADGDVRGYVTMKASELREIRTLFDQLANMSYPLSSIIPK